MEKLKDKLRLRKGIISQISKIEIEEEKEKEKEEEEEGEKDEKKDTDNYIGYFISMNEYILYQTKINHFQTNNGNHHKYFDNFYESYRELYDQYIESYLGIYPDKKIFEIEYCEHKVSKMVSSYKEPYNMIYNYLCNCEDSNKSELTAIKDEMKNIINKLLYLLNFD